MKFKLFLVALLLGVTASESALARGGRGHHGGGVRFSLAIGAPLFAYPYYRPYYYHPAYYPAYYPPVVVSQPAPPPVYIEQSNPIPQVYSQPAPQQSQAYPAPAPQDWWYYCADGGAYYPHVRQCASGWQRVAPQPPG